MFLKIAFSNYFGTTKAERGKLSKEISCVLLNNLTSRSEDKAQCKFTPTWSR